MSNTPRKPVVEPLTTLKGVGYAGRKNTGQERQPSDGEKNLVALDKMMTDSLRAAGFLPEAPSALPEPASPLPDIADYDPMKMPVWTLLMALAWIATRSLETVTWQRNDWRRENGLPEGSVPTVSLSAGEEDGENDPTAFRALAAFDQLRAAGEAAQIEVRAMALDRNEPTILRPLDWTYGKLSFDHQYDEVWRVGRQHYHTLTVQRDSLLQAFPPKLVELVQETSAPARLPATNLKARGHSNGIEAAVSVLWPEGLPDGLPVAERNSLIFREMQRQGTTTKASINEATFRRFFQNRSSK